MRRCNWFCRIAILIGLPCFSVGCAVMEIRSTLTDQADAWNRGDIDGFMSAYWNSPSLTFASGGTVTRGFASTLERYKTRYQTTKEMGTLTFDIMAIHVFTNHHAAVFGHWKLEREQPIEGLFTLIMRRERGKWIIIHDHTSAADAPSSAGAGHSKPAAGN